MVGGSLYQCGLLRKNQNSSHNPHRFYTERLFYTTCCITTIYLIYDMWCTVPTLCDVLYVPCVLHCVMVWCTVPTLCPTLCYGVMYCTYFVSYTVLWCDVLYLLCVLHCVMVWCTVRTLCPTLCYGVIYCTYFVSYTVLWCDVLYLLCVLHCVMVWCTVPTLCPTLCYGVMYCTYFVSYTVLWCDVLYVPCVLHCVMVWCTVRTLCPTLCYGVMYCTYLVSYTVLCCVMYCTYLKKLINQAKRSQVTWWLGLSSSYHMFQHFTLTWLYGVCPSSYQTTTITLFVHFQSSTCETIMPQHIIWLYP